MPVNRKYPISELISAAKYYISKTNRRITFENINLFGRQTPKLIFKGFDSEHMSTDITVKNIFQNGKKLQKSDFYTEINEFTENIVIE